MRLRQIRLLRECALEGLAGVEATPNREQGIAQAQGCPDIVPIDHGRLLEQRGGRLQLAAQQRRLAQPGQTFRPRAGALRHRRTGRAVCQHRRLPVRPPQPPSASTSANTAKEMAGQPRWGSKLIPNSNANGRRPEYRGKAL